MTHVIISIIIPVYNTPASYLIRCLDSLKNARNDIEIIIINDGSDITHTEDYKKAVSLYNNIILVNRTNQGVSASRNIGIHLASGDYIAFVDSDDIVTPNFFEDGITIIQKTSADIICGVIDFDGEITKQHIPEEYYFEKENVINAERALLIGNYLPNRVVVTGSPCSKLYKRTLFNTKKFDPMVKYFEDQLLNIELFHMANSIFFTPHKWYVYCQNEFSAMHKATRKNYALLSLPFFNALYRLIINNDYCNIRNELCVFGLNMVYNSFDRLYYSGLPREEIKNTIKKLRQNDLVIYLRKNMTWEAALNWKVKLKLILLKVHMEKLYKVKDGKHGLKRISN